MKKNDKLYKFILFAMLHNGKANLPFKAAAMILGKRTACRLYFKRLFGGCDMATFKHIARLYGRYGHCDIESLLEIQHTGNMLTGSFTYINPNLSLER